MYKFIIFLIFLGFSFIMRAQESEIIIKPITENSSLSEISNHYEDGLLYVYRNKPFYKIRSKYYDIYTLPVDKEQATGKFDLLKNVLNTKFNEGPIFFDKENSLVYVTRNVFSSRELRKKNLGINPLEIEVYSMKEGEITYKEKFRLNESNHSYAHAFYSPATKRLYFTSNREGAIGEQDLWYTYMNGKGGYTDPINLGKYVNSKENDAFTVVYNGILYYSTNGKHNKRNETDLDIYYVTELGATYGEKSKPLVALNSEYDDFGITFINGAEGYITSNRGHREDYNHDIYYFNLTKPVFGDNEYNLLFTSSSEEDIRAFKGSNPTIVNKSTGETIKKQGVDDGFIIEGEQTGTTYEIIFPENSKYKNVEVGPFVKKNLSQVFIIDTVILELKEQVLAKVEETKKVEATLKDTKVEPVKSAEVVTKESELEALKNLLSAKSSLFTYELENRKARIKKDPKVKDVLTFGFNSVYFEVNSASLTKEAKKELDVFCSYLKQYPNTPFKIWAHTDSRGNNAYNLQLSKERALEVKQYLILKGFEKQIKETKGFGETNLLNDCNDQTICSEDLHLINRRVELILLK